MEGSRTSRALALASVALAGCTAGPPPPRCELLRSQTVVVAVWEHERVTGEDRDRALGTNVDRMVSSGERRCDGRADFISPRSGTPGVDNQYATILVDLLEETMGYEDGVTAAVTRQLQAGDALVGFDLRVDATGEITAALVELEATGPILLDVGLRGLASDQRFRVMSRTPIAASCDDGFVDFEWGVLELPMGSRLGRRSIHDVSAHVVVEADGSLGLGELGAAVDMAVVLQVMIDAAMEPAIDLSLARTLTNPDLEPDASGGTCAAASLGVGMDLVPATFE